MKVLLLTHLFPSEVKPSVGTFSMERVKALSKYCEVKVVSFRFWFPFARKIRGLFIYTEAPSHDVIEGIEVFYPWVLGLPRFDMTAWQSILFFVSYLISLRRIRRDFDFDLIHGCSVDLSGFAAVLLGMIFHRPVIVTGEGSDIHTFSSYPLLGRLIRYTLRHCDRIIAVSAGLKDAMVKLGVSHQKIVVVHNGVDSDKFKPMDQISIRQKLNLPRDKKIILFVGALRTIKGLIYLVQAIKEMSRKRSDFLLVLVGSGPLQEELEAQVLKAGVEEYVRFVGLRPYDEIPKWMNACDVFCLPSLQEGFGVVLIEAGACGRPVVATRVGGIPEIVIDGETGLLVEPRSSEQLAEALERLISNQELCYQMGQNGRQRVLKNFDCHDKANQTMGIYEKVLSRFHRY
ncbi:MAG: glycosyltransferase family 4 protein [Planctomycetota bacterium]|nr:glycosyltransferase family 4 protein [Planctomycetota bacterium]